jgi:FAD/FMN-containing dehydrogenase
VVLSTTIDRDHPKLEHALAVQDGYGRLRRAFRGPVLSPDDDDYDEVRRIWNGMFDRRPALIARCLDADDVSAALRFARDTGLRVTVRGGGHNVAGASLADGAVLVDLSLMREVRVDAGRRVAVAAGGCLLRDLDRATTPHGLACPSGVVSHTGLGGLALGGGYGWLARKWGLTCDHIVGAEVVLADGGIVQTSEREEPDLLWALRGGGGNFGVVTRFTLALRPVGEVYLRRLVVPLDDARPAIGAYRTFAERQSNYLHAVAALSTAGSQEWLAPALRGAPALFLSTLWLGDPADGPAATDPLADAVGPATDTGVVLPYLSLQALGDHSEPAGHRYYTRSCYLADLSDDTAARLVKATRDRPSQRSAIDFEFLGGAIAENAAGAAFPHRAAPYLCTASAHWTDRDDDRANATWARGTVDALADASHGGVYVNYAQDESDPTASFGSEHYHRLAELKSRYDSANTFGGQQNIAPRAETDLR